MTVDIICRAITSGNAIKFRSEKIINGKTIGILDDPISIDLENVINNDKKYGLLIPKNGKSFGYFIVNKDKEITHKQARKGVYNALFRWWLELKFEFHRAKTLEEADLKFYFRTEEEDEILNSSTLAYMFYPLGSKNNGICVINMRFWWTLSGQGVDLHLQDPVNYPNPTGKTQGSSWDLDQVLGHEIGHGVFGLPHYIGMMASNYGEMEEYLTLEDILRGGAKVGRKNMLQRKYNKLKLRLYIRSDKE